MLVCAAADDALLPTDVQAALQMSPAQIQHARQLHTYYWNRMRGIMAERHQLSKAMLVRLRALPEA